MSVEESTLINLKEVFPDASIKSTSKGLKINTPSISDDQWDEIEELRARPYDYYNVEVKRSGAGLVILLEMKLK